MKIFFQPFVGKNYRSGGIFHKKMLILGESHYCDQGCLDCGDTSRHPACKMFTNERISDYLNPSVTRDGWMNTFLKFERSLVGHETSQKESIEIWNSLTFYNYLQATMGGPRMAGTDQDYANAIDPFFDVLETYQPELMIVWGSRLWEKLPNTHGWQDGPSNLALDGNRIYTGSYQLLNGQKINALMVHHPSTGYDWKYWNKVINENN